MHCVKMEDLDKRQRKDITFMMITAYLPLIHMWRKPLSLSLRTWAFIVVKLVIKKSWRDCFTHLSMKVSKFLKKESHKDLLILMLSIAMVMVSLVIVVVLCFMQMS